MLSGCATLRKFSPIESHTLEARQLTKQAESAVHRADWEQAEVKLLDAIRRCPEDHRSRAILARVLWQRGARQGAVEQLAESIQLSGRRDAESLRELGSMYSELQRYSAAQQAVDESLRLAPQSADAWALQGHIYKAQGDRQAAMSAFYRALSIRHDDPRTRLEIAKLFREQDDPQRALAILDASESKDGSCPHHGEVCYLRGSLLAELQRPGDAVTVLSSALQHGHAAEDLPVVLAKAQLEAGEALQARATLVDAESRCPPQYHVAIQELRRRIEFQANADGMRR